MSFGKTFAVISGFLFSCIIVALAAAVFLVKSYFLNYESNPIVISDILLEIPHATSLRKVSELLKSKGIIKDDKKFFWYLRLGRIDGNKIQAGFYEFSHEITPKIVAKRLLKGRDRSFAVTFKEGQTLIDLADTLDQLGLVSKEQFTKAMTSKEIVDLINAPESQKRQSLLNDTGGIEGYLYPDTYFFSKKDTAKDIIITMHNNLIRFFTDDIKKRIKELNTTVHQVLTLASIIEKETAVASERFLVASVYSNRLKIGMRLQADPTVIYGMKNYQGKIGKKDLLTYHDYNTYKIKGLPPGPISSVSIDSIKAALWPQNSNYYYFVSRNDGTHVFCENLSCHNKAVKKWQIDFFKRSAKALH